ncbi:MAG: FAD-dependent oxidoreductase [Deltaproteobacteria bacterium]|nr:FAD-dependent oxidoreductase [Deltaproteobacteria bacterium]
MANIRFTLDGEEIDAREGETILQVAERMGKKIPTLCHDPRLEPFSACFVCLVEMEGRPGFVPSCATKVAPGMKIRTDTPAVHAARKLALELIMSAHHADCVAPCRLQCPDHIDIQTYIAQIAAGEFTEALKTIKRTNPFPSVCGRVCPHTCELQCRRNRIDQPVAINPLKRFVADLDLKADEPYLPELAADTGKRVAVIGAGPAGMTAAYYLRQKGHAVCVFEMNPKAGGMLRYGIPRYRLPDDVLDREIAHISALGIEVKYGQKMGRDFCLADLGKQGFDAAFIAVGAWTASSMRVEGEDMQGVVSGIDFLFDLASDRTPELGKKVVVVGGGNTAIDAARSARRLGSEVTILYRRTRKEMPAEDYEVDEAEEEGVAMHFLAAPVALVGEGGRVVKIRAIRMELGEPDASGRRRPVPIEGSEFEIEVDTVISAIGQKPDPSSWQGEGAPGATRWSSVEADETTYQTGVGWVFAAGDCLTGAATAVEAIAGGRKAAVSIDRYLAGLEPLPIGKPFSDSIGRLEEIDEAFFAQVEKTERQRGKQLPAAERIESFVEVELGLEQAQALAEARRCLECGCTSVDSCTLRGYCEDYGVDLGRFEVQYLHRPVADDHPFIVHDPNKCILCGRCVRICSEQQGLGALGFVQRGFDTTVQPSMGMPLLATDCDACGQCVGACPTGALDFKRFLPKPGPFRPDCTAVVCGFCGLGCRLTIESTGGRYIQAAVEPGRFHNRGNLCVDGCFGHRYLETLPRLTRPRLRNGGSAREVSWEDALRRASEGLGKAAGGKGAAVVVNGPLTNEAAFCLQRLARQGLGSQLLALLDGPAQPVAFRQALRPQPGGVRLEDLARADVIWTLFGDPFELAPVAGIELRRAALQGAELVVISSRSTRLDDQARQVLRVGEGRQAALLDGLAGFAAEADEKALGELGAAVGIKGPLLARLVSGLRAAERPVVACGDDLPIEVAEALGRLLEALDLHARLLLLPRAGNARGREDMGLHPAVEPGGKPAAQPGPETADLLEAIARGELDGLLVFNTDPYGCPLDPARIHPDTFLALVDLKPSELADRADVLLPGAGLAEESGTVTSLDGRLLPTAAVRAPAGGRVTFDIIGGLARALSGKAHERPADVWAELARLEPALAGLADGLELEGRRWPE